MRVCDICGVKLKGDISLSIYSNTFLVTSSKYEVCASCAKKLKKYIRFEQSRQKGAKQCLK